MSSAKLNYLSLEQAILGNNFLAFLVVLVKMNLDLRAVTLFCRCDEAALGSRLRASAICVKGMIKSFNQLIVWFYKPVL